MTAFPLFLAAALGLLAVFLARQLQRGARARRLAQAAYFRAAAGLLDGVEMRVQPSGWARMSGRYQGAQFDLQAVPDTLTFRKLPSLWVMVTMTEPMPVTGEVHVMSRPGQTEVFSTFNALPVSVTLPPGFPETCALRCDDARALPADLLTARAGLFAARDMKELVISPKGLRIVVLAEEADRGNYLLFRDAEMGRNPFAAERLLPHLVALTQLRGDLQTEKDLPHD